MHRGAALGVVDRFAGEERIDPLPQAARLGKAEQQPQRLRRGALASEVVEQVERADAHLLEPPRGIGREKVSEVLA